MKAIVDHIKLVYHFLINQGINTETSIRDAARIRLSNGLAVFLVCNILFGLWIGKNWDTFSLIVMWTSALLHLLSLFLNHIGRHQLAKILVVAVANLITIFFSLREKQVDIYLFLIPISFLSFILFARRDRNYIFLSLSFSVFLLFFKLFSSIDFFPQSPPIGENLVLMQKIVHIELFFICLVFVYLMFREGKKTASLLANEIIRQNKSEEELNQYYHANLHLSQSEAIRLGDLDKALQEITKVAAETLAVSRVNIWKYEIHKQQIVCLAHYDMFSVEPLKGFTINALDYPVYFKHLSNESLLVINDARNAEASKEFEASYFIPFDIYSLMDIPIKIEGKMEAIICFEQTKEKRTWTINEREFGLNIASTTALAMETANRKAINLQLQDLIKVKNVILSVVAHDLRNPIGGTISACNVISNIIEDLEDIEKKNELKMYLDLITHGQQHAFDIINDLLETAALENSDAKLSLEKIELNSLIHPIVNFVDKLATKKSIKITHNFYKKELYAPINVTKFTRVLENLLSNAIKYTPRGGEISILLDGGNTHHLISVRDTGIGISKNIQKTIFDKFTSAKRTGTDNEATTGLGLFITKQIVEAHQGEIWVESTEGEGSTFYVKVPALH